MDDYILGVDLGQARDFTALAVVEQPLWVPQGTLGLGVEPGRSGWVSPAELAPRDRDRVRAFWAEAPSRPTLSVRHLERFLLGTSYPDITRAVAGLLATPPLRDARVALVVDATGVGLPVVDLFREAGLRPIAATITAGMSASYDPGTNAVHVPKRDLVSTIAVLLESRRLKIAGGLAEAPTLLKELGDFKRRITPAGNEQLASWRERQHDDLVLAVALACWWREWYWSNFDQAAARGRGYTSGDVA